ncbi:hypothetical protein [Ancylobacter sp. IITR112]|uniref:hypothetical protein n=1 Tax=Ancylobacter sp. IITR112 TaxID=3138073 RepID=UPI00352AE0D6
MDTPRKRAAVRRWQRREIERLPLFADEIAATFQPVDDVMEQRALAQAIWMQDYRDKRAALWRRARARLAAYGPNVRPQLLAYWNLHRWLPGDPVYLLDMFHMFDNGRIDLENRRLVA